MYKCFLILIEIVKICKRKCTTKSKTVGTFSELCIVIVYVYWGCFFRSSKYHIRHSTESCMSIKLAFCILPMTAQLICRRMPLVKAFVMIEKYR